MNIRHKCDVNVDININTNLDIDIDIVGIKQVKSKQINQTQPG